MESKNVLRNYRFRMRNLQSLIALLLLLFSLQGFAQEVCSGIFLEPRNVTAVDFLQKPGRSIHDLKTFKNLLTELKKNALFAKMFADFNEREKGIRIEQHVIQVFSQYLIERRMQTLSSEFIDILPITIALHDIGKPLAIQKGHRDLQYEYTGPLMREFLVQNHFSKRQIDISLALVSYAGLGELVRGQKTAFQVSVEIHDLAESLGVSALDFYNAKRVFYSADAGSYSQLRVFIFNELPDGRLDIKSNCFLELEHWLKGPLL